MTIYIYVEGGGDSELLKRACRSGFRQFIEKAGLKGSMPRVIACGGRQNAYEDFCTALEQGQTAMLLVDSETPFITASPWQHLAHRPGDHWEKPEAATNEQCHLMVECMENWFLADRDALKSFFGQGYKDNALPAKSNSIEVIGKQVVYDALKNATKDCKIKGVYGKGEHSFRLLAKINPKKVIDASPEANRFISDLRTVMGQK